MHPYDLKAMIFLHCLVLFHQYQALEFFQKIDLLLGREALLHFNCLEGLKRVQVEAATLQGEP